MRSRKLIKDIIEKSYTEEYINAVRGYGNPEKTLKALREENQ